MMRVTKLQCPNAACDFHTIASIDGTCFCGARMALTLDEDAVAQIAAGEFAEQESDAFAGMLSRAWTGHRR